MRDRTCNPSSPDSKRYAERGISCCESWSKFTNFLADMGERPEGMTLERKENHLGYYKENCRWATKKDQARNTRSNIVCVVNGKEVCLSEACEIIGMNYGMAIERVRAGTFHLQTWKRNSK